MMASPSSSSSSSSSSLYSSWSPSSKSSRSPSSPVHPASLVDSSTHSPELLQLLDIRLSQSIVEYVVSCVADTVDYALGRPPSPTSTYLKFTRFVSTVLSRAEVTTPTLLVALAYIHRSRSHISIAQDMYAFERVFLGAMVLASKFTQDSTLRNVHWAMVTGLFGTADITRIEREFLDVLDWELGVCEADLLAHHEGLLAASGAGPLPVSWALVKQKEVYIPTSPSSAPLPELELSSAHSSAGSLSPRTPSSQSRSAPVTPSGVDIDIDMAMDVDDETAHFHISFANAVELAHTPARSRVPARPRTPLPKSKSNSHTHTPARPRVHGHRRKLREMLNTLHSHHHHHYAGDMTA